MQYIWMFDENAYVGPFSSKAAATEWADSVRLSNPCVVVAKPHGDAKILQPWHLFEDTP